MKSLFALAFVTLYSGSAFAEPVPLPAPVCAEKKEVATAPDLKGVLLAVAPFCMGTCERDFDCMPGCSCHMSGRCM